MHHHSSIPTINPLTNFIIDQTSNFLDIIFFNTLEKEITANDRMAISYCGCILIMLVFALVSLLSLNKLAKSGAVIFGIRMTYLKALIGSCFTVIICSTAAIDLTVKADNLGVLPGELSRLAILTIGVAITEIVLSLLVIGYASFLILFTNRHRRRLVAQIYSSLFK
ncbi:unnamed protein product [Ambrosiozyma monospora]|uniref:Unnamed protein product n=1 Tax=Ambrosiozyma monospora TaxID=43982 RepID=A0ACB5T0E2_AMBMO|nr:unnamed protein product [Ambrosiozyma monospora]